MCLKEKDYILKFIKILLNIENVVKLITDIFYNYSEEKNSH
jgi:hypothetical protein